MLGLTAAGLALGAKVLAGAGITAGGIGLGTGYFGDQAREKAIKDYQTQVLGGLKTEEEWQKGLDPLTKTLIEEESVGNTAYKRRNQKIVNGLYQGPGAQELYARLDDLGRTSYTQNDLAASSKIGGQGLGRLTPEQILRSTQDETNKIKRSGELTNLLQSKGEKGVQELAKLKKTLKGGTLANENDLISAISRVEKSIKGELGGETEVLLRERGIQDADRALARDTQDWKQNYMTTQQSNQTALTKASMQFQAQQAQANREQNALLYRMQMEDRRADRESRESAADRKERMQMILGLINQGTRQIQRISY